MNRLFILLFTVLLCGQAFGEERSEEELLNIAVQVLNQPSGTASEARRIAEVDDGTTNMRVVRRLPTLSVVGSERAGFVVVSHDNRVRPVLGYSRLSLTSDALSDDPWMKDLPCGLEWYLQAMNERLQAMAGDGYEWTPIDIRPDESVKPQVEPLIETDWNQGSPFNDWLPTYVNSNGKVRHFASGCNCTATSQLMYYYRYPAVGSGENTYEYDPKQDGNPVSLSCRFDTVYFEWDKMKALYHNKRSSDEAANEAVARLYKAVGIALNIQYTEKNGSGTTITTAAKVLRNHFGYSSDTHLLSRSNYSDALWMHIIFEELSNGRPVYYRGQSLAGDHAHAFILDGYDADGMVHINWGWGRNVAYDGYFDMNFLQPNHYDYHYSTVQYMIVNARPEGMPIDMQEITVPTPGSLASQIPQNSILRLKVIGTLNRTDLMTLRQLGGGIKDADGRITKELTHLDLSDAMLPNNALPDSAFYYCSSLAHIELPTTLKRIGILAFRNCTSLNKLCLPSSVSSIGNWAFFNCTGLTTFTLPRDLYFLGKAPFAGSINIESFIVEEGNSHFSTIDGILTDVEHRTLISYPEARYQAIIPEQIDNIGQYAFRYCYLLKEITIPSNVKVIGENAFYRCIGLQKVVLEEGVQKIYNGAFKKCDSLRAIHLPSTINNIGSQIFAECNNVRQVICFAEHVPTTDGNAFYNSSIGNATLYVPETSLTAYQTQSPWNLFKEIIGMGTSATEMNIVDGEIYDNDNKMDNINVIYTRTFNNTNWQALYVPFAMKYDDWKDDFDVAEINNFHEYDDNEDGKVDRTVLEILYVKEGSTLPNTPYLIRAKETGTKVISLVNTTLYAAEENSIDCSSVRTKYTFTGTYTGVSGEEMYDNGYYALAGGTLSQPSSANVSLGSFRWYLKPENRTGNYAAPRKISVRVIGEADGETTSLAEAAMNDRQEEYYNLEGVRINRAEATGIYIVRYADGRMKKVIKK